MYRWLVKVEFVVEALSDQEAIDWADDFTDPSRPELSNTVTWRERLRLTVEPDNRI